MISIPYLICSILSFVPAIVCHEACHGFAAYKLGDPTAKRAGRLSFNPLKHIDPFGTVIMPLLLMAMNMPVFGYAKPVPYNPAYFKDPRKGDLIVGLAGPAANLVLAVLGAVVYTLVMLVLPVSALAQNDVFYYFLTLFLPMFSLINLYLMFFNLLPIPPLDGSSIFAFFLPQKYLLLRCCLLHLRLHQKKLRLHCRLPEWKLLPASELLLSEKNHQGSGKNLRMISLRKEHLLC